MTRYLSILFALLLWTGSTGQAQDINPQNLNAELTADWYVKLTWQAAPGQLPSSYEVWRGYISPDERVAQIYSPTAVQFTDYDVKYGEEYVYMVVAIYPGSRYGRAFTSIRIMPAPDGLNFTSDPKTTVRVGMDYVYAPSVDAANPADIDYMLVGSVPEGMTLNNVVGGGSYIYWNPKKAGVYRVTIVATNVRTHAYADQQFDIKVADKAGTLNGFVKTITNQPLAGAIVRFWQVSKNTNMNYEVRTDANGEFVLENVQVGRIYAYAEPPTDAYQPQWYINAPSFDEALERVLDTLNNNTLRYEFYLFASAGIPAPVTGRVVNESGAPVSDAKVSFIRKQDFIHIGDTSSLKNFAQDIVTPWQSGVIDTMVYTNFNGNFSVNLPVGREYYTIVEKDQYLSTFIGEETNAMMAKAIRIENSNNLNYRLLSSGSSNNKLYGKVSSKATGVSKSATIVLIDTELKRGAGGGNTYRKYRSVVTDSNGVFNFDNLPDSPPSALLAIPMDNNLAPQYYHSSGGRSNFTESEELSPLGTMQNINFELQETKRLGIGSYFGQVILRKGAERIPLAGTIVFAEAESTGKLAGYAITDSTGWYSIVGLEPGNYLLYADNPTYSNHSVFTPARASRTMPVTMTYVNSLDLNRTVGVNFNIDDLRTTVGVNEDVAPGTLFLSQNYPNPFNPSTTIQFNVPQSQHVTLKVINALGETVATLVDGNVEAGHHNVVFDADGMTSGVYFYQLQSNGQSLGKHMLLVK
ncbi:MAG: T9SS type A sorting domain-containing protein [Bacteroidetes bacterium]|nr:T9SS type A sorting domain-containing protein [Bacteroidota bacterium]